MKNTEVPHIICILDMSGSMTSSATDVINSYNTFLKEQQAERGDATLTLVFFDDKYELIYSNIGIQHAKPINSSIYYPRGMTAMYDAIGKTLESCKSKDAFVIVQTDGHENASSRSATSITKIIEDKISQGWDFMLLGAGISASKAGEKIGIKSKSVQFDKTSKGIEIAFSQMSNAASHYRASKDTVKLMPQSYKTKQRDNKWK